MVGARVGLQKGKALKSHPSPAQPSLGCGCGGRAWGFPLPAGALLALESAPSS